MKLKMISPDDIMVIVVSMIIFGIGIFAVFSVLTAVPTSNPHGGGAGVTTGMQNSTYYAIRNTSAIANNVFNIVGVVLIVGAIMIIVGIVYSYIRPRAPVY